MNVKSEILSEIDNLLSEYIAEKDSGSLRHSRESFVLGALEALDWIKNWIEPYDENRLPSDFLIAYFLRLNQLVRIERSPTPHRVVVLIQKPDPVDMKRVPV